MTRLLTCVVALSLAMGSAGCTSMRTVPLAGSPPAPVLEAVQAGDTVIVETRDGRRHRFVVGQVDGEAVVAEGGARYERADIVRLQRRSFSAVRTALLLGGFLVAMLAGESGTPF